MTAVFIDIVTSRCPPGATVCTGCSIDVLSVDIVPRNTVDLRVNTQTPSYDGYSSGRGQVRPANIRRQCSRFRSNQIKKSVLVPRERSCRLPTVDSGGLFQ